MLKNYDHKLVEAGIESKWRTKGYFSNHDPKKQPFSILMPPPNVTGKLHLGHAIDMYIQDTIIRYKKLKGFDVMWLPGMDHAGIATQSKVEDVLYKTTGQTRHDLGREAFVNKIWEWKDEYASIFKEQWAKIGLALDYSKERFTLDAKANQAVNDVFIDLYNKGFIYRGARAINWDVKLQTAISNIEVINEPTLQKMYYIKYFLENSNDYLTIATVRTETLLSDVAVVFNPNDERFKHLEGSYVIHPLTGERLPIIGHEYVDPEFGTGLMKLSAHAEADINIIQELGMEIRETIDKNGLINAPKSQFDKLERFDARVKIAQYLLENNFIEKVEEVISNVGVSDRSKTPVEILVLPQWFVKMEHFANLILEDIKSDKGVKFYPKRFEETMIKWMENIHDWNISRQLWWGHQIPAWYDANGNIKVQQQSPGKGWVQDPDVLDTWFSSGIAPFSFLGWPQKTSDLSRYYPFSLLVTGYDIIFFWVARMYFFGKEFMDQKPFERVLLHGLIRDEQGRKMSKSLNNGVDPMDMVEQYGSDSLRWFLITNTSPGMDIKFSTEKVQSAWRINNKLWNIAVFINSIQGESAQKSDADLWIENQLAKLQATIDKGMESYEFAIIGSEIQRFLFTDLSGWYIEMIKNNPSKSHALKILQKVLLVLHPFLPFITDKIHLELFNSELLEQELKIQTYENVAYIDQVIQIVTQLRKYREINEISKKEILNYCLEQPISDLMIKIINTMAYANYLDNKDFLIALNNNNLYIQVDQTLREKNKALLLKKIEFTKAEIKRAQGILANEKFVSKAPREKVESERNKLIKYQEELEKYQKELTCKY